MQALIKRAIRVIQTVPLENKLQECIQPSYDVYTKYQPSIERRCHCSDFTVIVFAHLYKKADKLLSRN